MMSDEPMFTTMVKAVPEAVPRIVPFAMLPCVDIDYYPASAFVSLLVPFTDITASAYFGRVPGVILM